MSNVTADNFKTRLGRLRTFVKYATPFNLLLSVGLPTADYLKDSAYTSSYAVGDAVRNSVIGEAVLFAAPAVYCLTYAIKKIV
jgi:hypothetical protein